MVRSFDLVNYSQVARATDYLLHDYRGVFSLLNSDPLTFLDFGTGGKSEPIVDKYYEEFERIYVEPRINDTPITNNNNEEAVIIKKAIVRKKILLFLYCSIVSLFSFMSS